jgi:hypothetical protein
MSSQREKSYSGKLGEWQRLLAPVTANAADLPQLDLARAQLEAFVDQGLVATKAQAAHAAAKQEISQQLKGVAIEGARLASLIRQTVKQHYGIRSPKLAEFGLQPFRGRKKKVDTPDTPGTPGTPGQAPSPTPPPSVEVKALMDPVQ